MTCSYFIRWRLHSTCLYGDDLEVICIMLVDEQAKISLQMASLLVVLGMKDN